MEPNQRTASVAAFRAGALAVSFFALVLAGCPEKTVEAPDGAEPTEHPATAASGSVGVRIHLPIGWVATPEGKDALMAGPRGRTVLRISRSKLGELPKLEEMTSQFYKNTKKLKIEPQDTRQRDDVVLWVARATAGEGPKAASWTLLLGARKTGDGVYLCSTEPGATDGEVEAAEDVCEHLGE